MKLSFDDDEKQRQQEPPIQNKIDKTVNVECSVIILYHTLVPS